MPPSVRLDPTDADFIDVIHSDATDIMFIGMHLAQNLLLTWLFKLQSGFG